MDIKTSDIFQIVGGDKVTRRGFVMLPNIVLRDQMLGDGPKLGFAAMISIAQNKTEYVKHQDDLAERCGVSVSTFRKWVKELEGAKFIETVKRGRGRPSLTKLNAQVKAEKGKTTKTAFRANNEISMEGADKYTKYGYTLVPLFILAHKKLNTGEKITYVLLLSYCWGEKNTCQVTQTTLANQLGCHRQSANRYLQELHKKEMIEIKNIGKMMPSIYTVKFKAKGE